MTTITILLTVCIIGLIFLSIIAIMAEYQFEDEKLWFGGAAVLFAIAYGVNFYFGNDKDIETTILWGFVTCIGILSVCYILSGIGQMLGDYSRKKYRD